MQHFVEGLWIGKGLGELDAPGDLRVVLLVDVEPHLSLSDVAHLGRARDAEVVADFGHGAGSEVRDLPESVDALLGLFCEGRGGPDSVHLVLGELRLADTATTRGLPEDGAGGLEPAHEVAGLEPSVLANVIVFSWDHTLVFFQFTSETGASASTMRQSVSAPSPS